MSFIYLASPYTPLNGESISDRVTEVCKASATLMQRGHHVFCPIVHSHYIADHMPEDLRLDHEFWMKQDLNILSSACALYVLMMPGWYKSKGINREIEYALEHRIPIYYLSRELEITGAVPSPPRNVDWGRVGLSNEMGVPKSNDSEGSY